MNPLSVAGSSGARTSFCDLTQKVPIDLILGAFSRLESELKEDEVMQLVRSAMRRAQEIGAQISS